MSTVPEFIAMCSEHGSTVRFRRVDSLIPCPCLTPEGFRDPIWHSEAGISKGIESLVDAGPGTVFTDTYLSYKVYVDAEDNFPVLPPVDNLAIDLTGTSGRIRIPFNDVQKAWGQVVIARSIGDGPFQWLGSVPSFSGAWIDNKPVGVYPAWADTAVICNEDGYLPDPVNTVDTVVKGFVQPIQSTRATRLSSEYIMAMFGEVREDDHLGILPITWNGVTLNFRDWSQSGEDFLEYDGQRFLVVNANKIPDPSDGNPNHHWEVGLRLISDEPMVPDEDNVVQLRPVNG